MNVIVLLTGTLITGIIVLNVWIGKYIFSTKIDQDFKNNGKKGTAKVKYYSSNSGCDNPSGQAGGRTAMVELFDENGNSLGGDYSIPTYPEIGQIIDVEYVEAKIVKYHIRPIGYKDNTGKTLNILIIIFIILGLAITIPLALNI